LLQGGHRLDELERDVRLDAQPGRPAGQLGERDLAVAGPASGSAASAATAESGRITDLCNRSRTLFVGLGRGHGHGRRKQ